MSPLQTLDGVPLDRCTRMVKTKSPKLQAFLEAALNPFRQFQADKLGEDWIQELRSGK